MGDLTSVEYDYTVSKFQTLSQIMSGHYHSALPGINVTQYVSYYGNRLWVEANLRLVKKQY